MQLPATRAQLLCQQTRQLQAKHSKTHTHIKEKRVSGKHTNREGKATQQGVGQHHHLSCRPSKGAVLVLVILGSLGGNGRLQPGVDALGHHAKLHDSSATEQMLEHLGRLKKIEGSGR